MTKRILTGYSCLLLSLFAPSLINAQKGPVAAGAEANGSGGTVSYSIGQIDYKAIDTVSGKVNQGLQQPFEILVVTGTDQNSIQLSCALYPNPAADHLILNITDPDVLHMYAQIADMSGKIISTQKLITNETSISLSSFPNACYFVRIIHNDKSVKSFKVIKNQ